jgi:hypothetical protein
LQRERDIRPRGRPQAREREEEGDHSREGSLYSKEATTSGGGRRGPTKTPPEEKEDTVGSVTMINSAIVNTKKWYRKEADLWAELGDKVPFG